MIASEEDARAFVSERCDNPALLRLENLVAMLAAENARQNLVSAASLGSVWQRHLADSAQLLDHVPRGTRELMDGGTGVWVDLGSGAGFPGLVIAAMRPGWRVVLVESRKRRIEWLHMAVSALSLPECEVEGRKVEQVPAFAAAVISARAFAPLARLLPLARRFSTSDTLWLLPKGRSAAQEVNELPNDLHTMFHVEHSVTDADSGIVVGKIMDRRG